MWRACERKERIHSLPNTSRPLVVVAKLPIGLGDPTLIGSGLVLRQRLGKLDGMEVVVVDLDTDRLHLFRDFIEHPEYRFELWIHPAIILTGHAHMR